MLTPVYLFVLVLALVWTVFFIMYAINQRDYQKRIRRDVHMLDDALNKVNIPDQFLNDPKKLEDDHDRYDFYKDLSNSFFQLIVAVFILYTLYSQSNLEVL